MCKSRHDPMRCLIPPYIAKRLRQVDDKKTDAEKVEEMFRQHRLKSDREFISSLPLEQRRMMASAVPGVKQEAEERKKARRRRKKTSAEPDILMYDCKHLYALPGHRIERNKVGKFDDRDAHKSYYGIYHCWKFFYDNFKRDSLDGRGLQLKNSIHYGKRFCNAQWDGRQMIYGDGDGKYFKSFTSDLDIIGHEFSHGLLQFTANFMYEYQPGALNESFADVFGVLIKQYTLDQDVKEADWLMGAASMLDFDGKKFAIRSLKAPGTAYINHPDWGSDPQPATMDGYIKGKYTDEDDWGGVHWNSGIPNYAFYVTAFEMGGKAWKKAGRIWYNSLIDDLRYNSTFEDAKQSTIKQARMLFGSGSLEEKAVKHGWRTAKV